MQHILRFEGGFERNFSALRRGASDYEAEDGSRCPVVPWPADSDGLRFGFMEQRGKRFVAVRVAYADEEVVLQHPVRLDPARHLGGRRFSAKPIPLANGPAGTLLGDILDANAEQREQLATMRGSVRRDLEPSQPA